LSSQKSLIAHAQSKISLFAAQEGLRAYAGKGKVEIQAQGDGADLIARKGIQIISTEENVDIKSPKEIILTAGGSQLKITSAGIFPTTAAKFEVKAGQHKFVDGAQVSPVIPPLPTLNIKPAWIELALHTENLEPVSNAPFTIIFEDGSTLKGTLDKSGFKRIENAPNMKYEVFFGDTDHIEPLRPVTELVVTEENILDDLKSIGIDVETPDFDLEGFLRECSGRDLDPFNALNDLIAQQELNEGENNG
ncbi:MULTISPECIES: DUF2345 domain-containing protein, partial [unclassified Acinetobacter]|uniref:DUF2345 domain-containing protein n=1 Tax=unclassified Acinetobacter TaxID=196816 RepID=UPI0015D2DF9F